MNHILKVRESEIRSLQTIIQSKTALCTETERKLEEKINFGQFLEQKQQHLAENESDYIKKLEEMTNNSKKYSLIFKLLEFLNHLL